MLYVCILGISPKLNICASIIARPDRGICLDIGGKINGYLERRVAPRQKLHHSILDEITDFIALPSYYLVNFAHDAAAELMLLMKKQTNKKPTTH